MRYWNKLTGCIAYESDSAYLHAVEQEYLNNPDIDCSFREYVESDDAFYTDYDIITAVENEHADTNLETICACVTSTETGYVMPDGYVLTTESDADELLTELCNKSPNATGKHDED